MLLLGYILISHYNMHGMVEKAFLNFFFGGTELRVLCLLGKCSAS
jgi:hypothetical protein